MSAPIAPTDPKPLADQPLDAATPAAPVVPSTPAAPNTPAADTAGAPSPMPAETDGAADDAATEDSDDGDDETDAGDRDADAADATESSADAALDPDAPDPDSYNGRVLYAPDPAHLISKNGCLPWWHPVSLAGPALTDADAPPAPIPNADAAARRPLSPRQARFVAAYVTEPNGTRAAIKAGYSPRSAHNQSSRMMKNDEVLQKIADLRAELGLAYAISRETLLDKLESVYDFAVEQGRFMPAVRAVLAQAHLSGLFPPRDPGYGAPAPVRTDGLPRWPGLPALKQRSGSANKKALKKRSGSANKKALKQRSGSAINKALKQRALGKAERRGSAPKSLGSRVRGSDGKGLKRKARVPKTSGIRDRAAPAAPGGRGRPRSQTSPALRDIARAPGQRPRRARGLKRSGRLPSVRP